MWDAWASVSGVLRAFALAGLALAGMSACGGEDPVAKPGATLGDGQLADPCERTEDCASGLCVRLDHGGGICSQTCSNDFGCPEADNWACLPSSLSGVNVCACLKLGESEVCADHIDNDCDGVVDDCRVCDGQQVPDDDPRHCGGCGNACRADETCQDGQCSCANDALVECAGACVDLGSDVSHCGQCSSACGQEQVCSSGACVCPDALQPDFCAGLGCLDLSSDSENCGACGEVCTLSRVCSAGECVCPAGAPPDFCPGVGCVDLQSDLAHCGGCDLPCDTSRVCSGGSCECPAGQTDCGGECVNTNIDPAHCGGCGDACGPDQACSGGHCGCTNFGYSVCGTACYDLDYDAEHCGACNDAACVQGEECSSGDCLCESELYCDSLCMPLSDDQNCGACDNACPDGQYCSVDQCVCSGFGLTACGDECFDLNNDEQHCGGCNATPCKNGESCLNGYCQCPAGETWCAEAGDCVNLSSDASHCGTCGIACDPTEICQNNVCKCPSAGYQYCASQGACTNLQGDAEHCGACDDPCNPTEVCKSGVCDCNLGSELYCASTSSCVDVWSNEAHCGSCDNACPAETSCISTVCKCDAQGYTLCPDDLCYDLQTDATHCGTCDTDCSGNYACVAGKCKCADPIVGPEVRLTNDTGEDAQPSLVWNGTHVAMAYSSLGNVRFALLNPDGTLVSDVAVTTYPDALYSPRSLKIVWTGSEYGILFLLDYGMVQGFARVDGAGALLDAVVLLEGAEVWTDLGWSETWGYATTYGHKTATDQRSIRFRMLGADASLPAAPDVYNITSGETYRVPIAPSPDGSWGVAGVDGNNVIFQKYNPNGTRTEGATFLGNNVAYAGPSITWDGAKWTVVWGGGNDIQMYRSGAFSVSTIVSLNSVETQQAKVTMAGPTLAVSWMQRGATWSSLWMNRFALPTNNGSSAGTPIHNAVNVVVGEVIRDPGDFDLVATGPASMLAVWRDIRDDIDGEIYAAPIDLGDCP